ncbi:MAG TPA: helix-turn-helix transcriptional regulator [Bauldia sp.]|nr:helix-turn-helix transcriptional regulator [Bauldia sp.]
MIRAAAATPLLRWLQARGHALEPILKDVNLASLPHQTPMQPIPLLSVMALLQRAGQLEGPDVSCRIVSETSVLELLLLGKVALGASTPREAMTRISFAIPYFCTHEHLTIEPSSEGVIVREFFAVAFPPDTLHLVHQYVAEMTRALCRMAGAKEPILRRIEMAPHPEFGLDHLRRWFGDRVAPTKRRTLSVFVDASVVDRPFPSRARDRMAGGLPPDLMPLRGDGTLRSSARVLIAEMLAGGIPSVEGLADLAGMSVRTLQRRLDAEKTNFSTLLDDVRRSVAMERLAAGKATVGALSAELGYARQASFTRAVRRWTGRSPRQVRSGV